MGDFVAIDIKYLLVHVPCFLSYQLATSPCCNK